MKKTSLFLISVLAFSIVSCDMDTTPYDAIPDTEALTTPTDFANLRVGLYSALRSSVGAETFWNAPDIQCDQFHAVDGFSNTQGTMYRWTFDASSGISGVYTACQGVISRANFIIDGYNKCDMSNKTLYTDANLANVKQIKGESYFARAYAIFQLVQFYCADYEATNADEPNSGASYRTDYAPSSDQSSYPGRNTLRESFKQINNDLDSAAVYITKAGAPCDIYISADAITAMRARVALAQEDHKTAADAAASLISAGTFTLAADAAEMAELWQQDGGNETILQFAIGSRDELVDPTGEIFQPYQSGSVPDYLPTQNLIDLYSDNDVRKTVYFNTLTLTTNKGITGTVYGFNKFVDHTRVYTDFNSYEYARFVIEPKMFRIAEMYLIAAEAYAQQNDIKNATKYLTGLKAKRITGYTAETFANKMELMQELQKEREREMVGEGTRLIDLKRWHLGMKRGVPQQEDLCNLPGPATTSLTKSANDYKMVWPIPKHEMDVNPKIKQNPGY